MPSETLYRYQIWCITEDAWVLSDYRPESEGAPTTCPHNTTHTIDPDSVATVETVPPNGNYDTDGNLLTTFPTKGLSGLPAITAINVPVTASNYKRSWQVTALPSVVTIKDICIRDDLVGPSGLCYIVGGTYKCRDSAVEGSSLSFSMVDRDDVTGYFPMFGLQRTRMVLSSVTGTIFVNDIVLGGTSHQTARVLEIVDPTHVEITFADGPFTDGEPVSFSGGASADCDDWIEGDVLYLTTAVRDEWIEGKEDGGFEPGDSRALVQGLYFRVTAYNASTTDNLRMKIGLEMGRE